MQTNEKGNSISILKFDEREGKLEKSGEISTLPSDYHGKSEAGEIIVRPDGKYNRTHDTICVFKVEEEKLTPVEWVSCRGKTPRFIGMNQAGTRLFAANEDSDSIEVFDIDKETGKLSYSGISIATGSPVCIVLKE